MKNKLVIGLVVLLIMGIVAISGCTDSGTSSSSNGTSDAESASETSLNVTNVKVVSQGYGSYDIKATITPDKDYSYLEMVLIWYDFTGAVIEKNSLVWNINDVSAGQTLKVTGNGYISGEENPAKVDVLIFDSVFSGSDESGAIYKKTIEV
ncbi:MAG: hypothetical protein Q7U35_11915 [Methanobacteriaceae archaeon]|jgi:hypothetical protein|nr:hypothetical protein [Methanobacteriaceae archaeon]MDP2836465.1 hypothetical protein [Methanobacteriaceae archaeon]MDP3035666.1 hypothetical protein [Methanobacteriaceae archaeon]MDP3486213.1 hypothetical protein [Methanobacteriaceae archaeon]MDP3624694.1 hypothetical protein [Methanobacteriaceae archaeon]